MSVIPIQFGEWLPDLPELGKPGLTIANNVYPTEGGYSPFLEPVSSGDGVTGNVIGAKMFYRADGNSVVVGGTSTTLFVYTGGTVTTTNPPYTAASSWRFERFGDLIIAVSKENAPQYLSDIDSDTSWSALPGSPPKASVVGRVGDFLAFGNTDDGTDVQNRVWWSAFNNPTATWQVDYGELSGWQDLNPRYGKITGIVGGRWGLVFQERAIWRMTFVGSPKVFEFEEVATDRGCVAPDSIATIGYQTFFLSRGGFCVTNGSEVEWLGSGRINKWFEAARDASNVSMTQAAINWPMRCIVWSYRVPGVAGFQNQIIYSFTANKFTTAEQAVDILVQANQDALTLSDLATLFPSGLGTMSAYEIGTSEWQAQDQIFACFVDSGSTSYFAPFTGDAAEATIETGDYSLEPGRRARVTGIGPLAEVSTGTLTARVRSRATQGGVQTSSAWTSRADDGFAPANADNWYHAFGQRMAAGAVWDKASGLLVKARASGLR